MKNIQIAKTAAKTNLKAKMQITMQTNKKSNKSDLPKIESKVKVHNDASKKKLS